MPDIELSSHFFAAVRNGDADTVRACLDQDPALAAATDADSFDSTAVIVAASRGDRDMIDLLLARGADLDQPSGWWAGGFTALTSGHPRPLERDGLAEFLIERGATVDARAAAGLGRLERLRELVAADAAVVNEPGGDGLRPLHYACSAQIAAWLLDHGAEIDARDVDHLGMAAQWNAIARPDVSRFLVERGAGVDIFLAITLDDAALVHRCLDADAGSATARVEAEAPGGHVHLYTVGPEGTTAAMAAARFAAPAVLTALLDAGASLEPVAGRTPLHYAAWGGRRDNAKLLLARGVDRQVRDDDHSGNAAGWAGHFGHDDLVDFLHEQGVE